MSVAAGAADKGVLALTGATGFIGARVLPHLVAAGWRVRALYRPHRHTPAPLPHVDWIPGDLADAAALAILAAGADAVVHLAGAVRGARRADFYRINAEGTRNLVQAAARTSTCRRFLLLSSLAARAPQLSDYAGSKRAAEQMLQADAGALQWAALRPPAVYGPGDRELRGLFRIMAHGWAPTPGHAYGHFSLLYVDDLAAAITRWLAGDADPATCFELDDGHPGGYDWNAVTTVAGNVLRNGGHVRQVPIPLGVLRAAAALNLVRAHLGGPAPMLTPGKLCELTYPDWVCDSAPFRRATGWHAEFGLARGLAATFAAAPVSPQG